MSNFLEELTAKIKAYADNDGEYGWWSLEHNGKTYRFPKRAMFHCVYRHHYGVRSLLPEYEAFSPMGLKMSLDNQFHSDVLLGAGLSLQDAYDYKHQDYEVWISAQSAFEREFAPILNVDFRILANGLRNDFKSGWISIYEFWPPLAKNCSSSSHVDSAAPPNYKDDLYTKLRGVCIPHAGVDYEHKVKNADVVITEVGGPLSHLSTVCAENGKLLIRIDNACKRFEWPTRLSINLEHSSLRVVRT